MNAQGWVMIDSKKIFCIIFLLSAASSFGMTYDYRWMPFLPDPNEQIRFNEKRNSATCNVFMATGSEAISNGNTVNIPSLSGSFDQKQYAQGMVKAGYPNLLPPDWNNEAIPWSTPGKIQAQGLAFAFNCMLWNKWVSTGVNFFCMNANTYEYFNLDHSLASSSPEIKQELDEIRRTMFDQVGLTHNQQSVFGFSDVDWYLRFGHASHYSFKCRYYDIGARLGVLIPSGKQRTLHNPFSIPFGGNGHWGVYGTLDGLFELREDLKIGYIARISKRFPKTSCQRLPVNDEPGPLGITTGLARVSPGFTFVFAPLIALENLREGLGASIQYTMTKHLNDTWRDAREDTTIPVTLSKIEQLSGWGSDYFTVNVFYDFGRTKTNCSFAPIVSFRWDIPAALYVTDNLPSINRVSIGIECVF